MDVLDYQKLLGDLSYDLNLRSGDSVSVKRLKQAISDRGVLNIVAYDKVKAALVAKGIKVVEAAGMRRLGRLVESDPSGGTDPGTAFAHAGAGHYPTGWGYASKKGSGGAVRARYRFTAPGEVEVWDRRSGQDEKDAIRMSFKDFDKDWRAL